MSIACSLAASQSTTFARIAPRRVPRSAASTGRDLPVISRTIRAPIALACARPCISRPCAISSVAPCRSSVKSGPTTPRASLRSHDESSPACALEGEWEWRGAGDTGGGWRREPGFDLGGRSGACAPARTPSAGGDSSSAALITRFPGMGSTVETTRAHSAASSGESDRPVRLTVRRGARAYPSAEAAAPARARSYRRRFAARRRPRPRTCRNGSHP